MSELLKTLLFFLIRLLGISFWWSGMYLAGTGKDKNDYKNPWRPLLWELAGFAVLFFYAAKTKWGL